MNYTSTSYFEEGGVGGGSEMRDREQGRYGGRGDLGVVVK